VLACDDETLRPVGERLGYDATEDAQTFAQDVKVALEVGLLSGFKSRPSRVDGSRTSLTG
jgi:hypothetical protein